MIEVTFDWRFGRSFWSLSTKRFGNVFTCFPFFCFHLFARAKVERNVVNLIELTFMTGEFFVILFKKLTEIELKWMELDFGIFSYFS